MCDLRMCIKWCRSRPQFFSWSHLFPPLPSFNPNHLFRRSLKPINYNTQQVLLRTTENRQRQRMVNVIKSLILTALAATPILAAPCGVRRNVPSLTQSRNQGRSLEGIQDPKEHLASQMRTQPRSLEPDADPKRRNQKRLKSAGPNQSQSAHTGLRNVFNSPPSSGANTPDSFDSPMSILSLGPPALDRPTNIASPASPVLLSPSYLEKQGDQNPGGSPPPLILLPAALSPGFEPSSSHHSPSKPSGLIGVRPIDIISGKKRRFGDEEGSGDSIENETTRKKKQRGPGSRR